MSHRGLFVGAQSCMCELRVLVLKSLKYALILVLLEEDLNLKCLVVYL